MISLKSDSKKETKMIMSLSILMAKLRYLLFFVDLYLINYLVCILSSVAKQEGQHCVMCECGKVNLNTTMPPKVIL